MPAGERHQCLTRDRVGTKSTEQCADSTERTSPEEIDEAGICGTVLTGCVTTRCEHKPNAEKGNEPSASTSSGIRRQRSRCIPERAFEKTTSTRSTSGTRLSTVDNGEVKKDAVRTQEAFLEFEQCLQRCKARDTCRSRDGSLRSMRRSTQLRTCVQDDARCERTDLSHHGRRETKGFLPMM